MSKEQAEELINNSPVIMFSKSYCPFCDKAKDLLNRGKVEYKTVELDQVPDGAKLQDALEGLSGQRTVPNIYIGGQHVGGCDDLMGKHSSGELVALLADKGVAHQFWEKVQSDRYILEKWNSY